MPPISKSKYFDPRLFAKVANLQMIARSVVEGMISGRHKSPFHGFSVEFSEYRKYTPGDDPKYIDWKALAKSDKVYVKEFEAETNLRAHLLLDSSASMGFSHGKSIAKLRYASFCVAAMSYLMIRQQDAVGFVAFDSNIRHFLPPKSSPRHLQDILTVMEGIQPGGQTDLSASFHNLAERIKRRGLILVFSDFLDDPERILGGLAHFRHKRHEVILFHVIDPAEEDFPFDDFIEFQDMETNSVLPVQPRLMARQYRERFQAFREELRGRCAAQGIEYVPARTDKPVEIALLEYLGKRMKMG